MKPIKIEIPNDTATVRKIPDLNGKDKIKGFKLIRTLFVDTSGLGSPNEPALTFGQLLDKIKVGMYYGFVDIGQFQGYIGEFEKLEV